MKCVVAGDSNEDTNSLAIQYSTQPRAVYNPPLENVEKIWILLQIALDSENYKYHQAQKKVDKVCESAMRFVIHPKEEKNEQPEKKKKHFFWQKSKK